MPRRSATMPTSTRRVRSAPRSAPSSDRSKGESGSDATAPGPFSSPSPGALAKPLRDDVLHARAHLHPLMEGRGVGCAVGAAVVPGEQLAGLGLDDLVDRLEARRAARLGFVEVEHHRPRALARDAAEALVIDAERLEIVGVLLELLPDGIALALHRFAKLRVEPGKGTDLRVQLGDQRVMAIEVAGLAGAIISVAVRIGDGRGAPRRVDLRDQRGAGLGIDELAAQEQRQLGARHALHAGRCGERRYHVFGGKTRAEAAGGQGGDDGHRSRMPMAPTIFQPAAIRGPVSRLASYGSHRRLSPVSVVVRRLASGTHECVWYWMHEPAPG